MEDKKFLSQLNDSIKLSCQIDNELFEKFDVKRGLRNKDNTGVLVGLTNIGEVLGYKKERKSQEKREEKRQERTLTSVLNPTLIRTERPSWLQVTQSL